MRVVACSSPGGVLIPQRDTIWAALVEANEIYSTHYEDPWRRSNDGFDLEAARQRAVNAVGRHHLTCRAAFERSSSLGHIGLSDR